MLFPDSPFQTRSSLCVDDVLDKFSLLAGRFYAMLSFKDGEKDRELLDTISENIKSALQSRIKMADWLDSDTRDAAIKKLSFMEKTVGYSTSSPDQRSPHEMYAFANGLEMDAENFYENERSVRQWTLKHYWNTLGRPIGRTEWLGVSSPQVINAFNLLSKNSIFVSTGFAQKPNFDSKYPDYINYAAIGQTLGHEYSHGFDDFGSQYDELGIERNWWSDEVHNKYVEKSECFTKQYSKATIRDDDGKKYHIDGTLTLGENIADNEGLAAAYHAYKLLKESGKSFDPVLPGLHKFSPEALFFINAGRSFCSKPLPGTLVDAHAPDSVRANFLFQNSEEFSKIFHCPAGSKMNPKNKCKIW
ncbi:zincin [Backusella circina FSU 941]|nr:zincin [Backusella circina FSU 941]